MAANHPFPRLFSTLKVGERILRNRIVLAATLTNYGVGHRVTDRWINFLSERAKGGCGMIVTEIIAVDATALAHDAIVAGYEAENEEGFKRTAEAVEGAGACLLAQLWHPGRQQGADRRLDDRQRPGPRPVRGPAARRRVRADVPAG